MGRMWADVGFPEGVERHRAAAGKREAGAAASALLLCIASLRWRGLALRVELKEGSTVQWRGGRMREGTGVKLRGEAQGGEEVTQ